MDEDSLSSANSLNGLSRQVSQMVGPVIGTASISLAGAALAFGFNGLTFLISALCLLALRAGAGAIKNLPQEGASMDASVSARPSTPKVLQKHSN